MRKHSPLGARHYRYSRKTSVSRMMDMSEMISINILNVYHYNIINVNVNLLHLKSLVRKHSTIIFSLASKIQSACLFMSFCISLVQIRVCLCLHLDQGQEEGVLWFWLGSLGSGGPLQERHAGPQLQRDPENQRQQKTQIGLFMFFMFLLNVER